MGNNTAAIIILGILAVTGLGLSAYMFVSYEIFGAGDINGSDGFNGIDGEDGLDGEDGTILVALWEDLDKNIDTPPFTEDYNFLLEYLDNQTINPNYVTVGATNFTLTTPGFYKITVSVFLSDLETGERYWIQLIENGLLEKCLIISTAMVQYIIM